MFLETKIWRAPKSLYSTPQDMQAAIAREYQKRLIDQNGYGWDPENGTESRIVVTHVDSQFKTDGKIVFLRNNTYEDGDEVVVEKFRMFVNRDAYIEHRIELGATNLEIEHEAPDMDTIGVTVKVTCEEL